MVFQLHLRVRYLNNYIILTINLNVYIYVLDSKLQVKTVLFSMTYYFDTVGISGVIKRWFFLGRTRFDSVGSLSAHGIVHILRHTIPYVLCPRFCCNVARFPGGCVDKFDLVIAFYVRFAYS